MINSNNMWLLTVVFIVLKLTENIDWSWWIVLSPILGYLLITTVVMTIKTIIQEYKEENRRQNER